MYSVVPCTYQCFAPGGGEAGALTNTICWHQTSYPGDNMLCQTPLCFPVGEAHICCVTFIVPMTFPMSNYTHMGTNVKRPPHANFFVQTLHRF
jgi:hypothetical protein